MRVIADPDLADLLRVEVDPTSEPVDWDTVVARLSLHIVKQSRTSPVAPAAGVEFSELRSNEDLQNE